MPVTFRDKLQSNKFMITTEVTPPKGVDTSSFLKDAEQLQRYVDAFNVTDNQRAVMRMSSIAVGKMLKEAGHETIVQFTCRDRNRLALQSDLLGAWALGIHNICVMTGDHTTKGDHPATKPVYDLDSVQLLNTVKKLNEGYDLSGNRLEQFPDFVVGAVSNTDPLQPMQHIKLRKKTSIGIDFIQTQAVYDIEEFACFLEKVSDIDVPIIAGIIPLKSAKMAKYMNRNIPGIRVPEEFITRMENAEEPASEGMEIATKIIRELKKMCRGIHLMPVGQHTYTREILKMSGSTEGRTHNE
ncbi:methylenetetrahydrofolate reductase [uncultured Methanomethylovorans sp.]|uniref:methylenetetrahydrofolate reductase n=1 Tax=uncultured Methanomethylovorans sp. TaxID=183759 RepID=UPI002AA7CD6A|nr:methylenetetrahydrofolate reductase [uncultured Methanomethylovorans sp.]